MCAITGYIGLDAAKFDPSQSRILAMSSLAQSSHRGPDHSGVSQFANAVIGHNRLKITDLSDDANQPMTDCSGKYFLVFNGEIFNFKELRKELEALGVAFQTHSDTEVLLYALIQWGQGAINRLNGFFAFAFHNVQDSSWIIARDRLGEKPLFYYQDKDKLCFASELRALMAYDVPFKIDFTSLSILLQFTYIPAPSTILKNVFKLNPGEMILVRTEQGRTITESRLWYTGIIPDTFSDVQRPAKFRQLLDDAVHRRLHSDVPLGCFLSGGVDSSVIALLASRHEPSLRTFSVGFPDQPFMDETKYAVEVSKHLGTMHEVFPLEAKSFGQQAVHVWESMDEPFADASALAVWLLSRETSARIKVALSGDGADELFGGYNKHAALLRSMEHHVFNEWLPNFAPIIEILPAGRSNAVSNKMRQIRRYTKGLEKNIKSRYLYWSSFAEGSYHEDILKDLNHADKGSRLNHFIQDIRKDDFNSVLLADQQMVLSGDMLTKVDVMSMAHGIEVRPPFLDHRVVEFVNALKPQQKITRSDRKILLRECFAKDLPESVFKRSKKGFEVPLEKMMRTVFRPYVDELMSSNYIQQQGIFKPELLETLKTDFCIYKRNTHTSLLYSILVFQVWYRKYS